MNTFVKILVIMLWSLIFANKAVFSYPTPSSNKKTHQKISRIFSYKYVTEKEILALKELFPDICLTVNATKKKVYLLGTKKSIRRLQGFLQNMDQHSRSIDVSAIIIEISRNKLKSLGIEWQDYMNALKTDNVKSYHQFLSALNSLIKEGSAKLLANPSIHTIENRAAELKIGDRIPYVVPINSDNVNSWQLQYLDAGIALNIESAIISSDIVHTSLRAEITSIKQWKATEGGEYPVLSTRKINLECQIKNGESLILGGLVNSNERRNKNTVPVLGDIPLIGSFFSSEVTEEDQTEIIFVLSPQIADS